MHAQCIMSNMGRSMSYTDWRYVEEYTGPVVSRGIRALTIIPSGTVIGCYDGALKSFPLQNGRLLEPHMHKRIVQIAIAGDSLLGLINTAVAGIDYINHSCEPNITPRDRIVLVTHRLVLPGEPLTLDYRRWDLVPEGIPCWCDVPACTI
jgi:uncharacterized protein